LLVPTIATAQRTYWPVSVDSLAAGQVQHTHVQVTGRVRLVRHEGDGDLHLKLTGVTGFIVAECIPALPCAVVPKVGDRVTVRGISRYDGEHHWHEVHPVEAVVIEP
jgi:hypothetical protein